MYALLADSDLDAFLTPAEEESDDEETIEKEEAMEEEVRVVDISFFS